MWNTDRIPLISPIAVQKRLPFPISEAEVSNFIGNFSLAPESLPVTRRTKYILHALIKELLIQEKISEKLTTFEIPDYIEAICATEIESCLIILDSIQLPDYCDITDKTKKVCATLLQIHPVKGQLEGTCHLDFGTTDRQIIHLAPQKIMRIPTPTTSDLKIKISLKAGNTAIKTDQSIEIMPSNIGLIIDTRESDVLLKSNASEAKQLAIEWLQSFDVQTTDI